MANHPNRSTRTKMTRDPPAPADVISARQAAGDTQTTAAERVYATLRTWQNWETEESLPEHRRMHPAIFELYLLKTGLQKLGEIVDEKAHGRAQEEAK